nr:hypothetical protein [Flavobacteriaceae bacterium]
MFLFIIGICHSQETLFSPLDSLTDRRDLSSLNSALSIIDTTELSTIQKAQYNYYLGSLLYFEDNNKEATEALLLSKKLIPNTSENDSFRFKVNDRLLECIGSTTEYSIRPAQL